MQFSSPGIAMVSKIDLIHTSENQRALPTLPFFFIVESTVKFMSIDDSVGIQGNGNQDTQSWFHSQEINVMIDSPKIVQDWMNGLISNQNTQLYGQVHPDGIWRDAEGHTVRVLSAIAVFK
jgi:hypothetical protein